MVTQRREDAKIDVDLMTVILPVMLTRLAGLWAKRFTIVGQEPIEGGMHLRVQPQAGACLYEGSAFLRVANGAGCFRLLRPRLDLCSRFCCAIRIQPGANFFV